MWVPWKPFSEKRRQAASKTRCLLSGGLLRVRVFILVAMLSLASMASSRLHRSQGAHFGGADRPRNRLIGSATSTRTTRCILRGGQGPTVLSWREIGLRVSDGEDCARLSRCGGDWRVGCQRERMAARANSGVFLSCGEGLASGPRRRFSLLVLSVGVGLFMGTSPFWTIGAKRPGVRRCWWQPVR